MSLKGRLVSINVQIGIIYPRLTKELRVGNMPIRGLKVNNGVKSGLCLMKKEITRTTATAIS